MSETPRAPRPFVIYALGCALVALAALSASWAVAPPAAVAEFAVLFVLVLVAELLAVSLPSGGSMSMSVPLTMTAVVLLGPTEGALVALGSAISLEDFRRHKPPAVVCYNVAQLLLATLASAWLYYGLGGRRVLGAPLTVSDSAAEAVAVLALALTSFLVNSTLVAGGISLFRRVGFMRVWRESVSWVVVPQVVLAALGVALAQVIALLGFPGLALFVFPLIVARQLYQRYVGLKDAYLDTVRSLVAALEAKDPYTRGHSERVAKYAVDLGQAAGVPEAQIERLELAALMHDLGKVGIRSSVLGKAGSLTHDEFDEIRLHPEIGARILGQVPYLSDIVPAVVAHHERVDGGGYGQGLTADAVPFDARILAVADSYDAMTTRRPYRSALSHEEALEELRLGAGTQFDADVVAHFLRLMGDERPLAEPEAHVAGAAEAVIPHG